MTNSLKSKLSKLRYQGKITNEEYKELIDKLEGHDESLVEQIKWERDTAIEQLKQLGYGLGEKVEPCEDCISREAVRRILANQRDELVKLHTVNPKDNPKADAMAYGVNWSLNTLMELPPVKPQRPKGKWIDKKMTIKGAHGMAYGRYVCSVCKKKFPNKSNYCPNCGAKMEDSNGE